MLYRLSVWTGLIVGCIPIFYYFKACIERDRMGLSSPYSRIEDARKFDHAGEYRVYEALKTALDSMLTPGMYFLSKGPVILKHAPGRAVPTCEIDHLIICRFGIFVVETKDWGGAVRPGPHDDELIVSFDSGYEATRRSPLAQCASKIAFIKRCQPVDWRVESIAVFSNSKARLSKDCPRNMILLPDIEDYLRARHREPMGGECGYVDTDIGKGRILIHRDNRPNAAAIHRTAVQHARHQSKRRSC